MPDNQTPIPEINLRLKQLREYLGLSQHKMATQIGSSQSNVGQMERGDRRIGKTIAFKIVHAFEVNPTWWETGQGEILNSASSKLRNSINLERLNTTNAREVKSFTYEELPYISIKARASFAELGQSFEDSGEYYNILKSDPSENYMNQVIVEIDGDSMEPYLISGAKVRCKEVDRGDWQYLNSGVYVVTYGNYFVVKRIKNSPTNGVLCLHSDNVETGGKLHVQLDEIRKIWRVLRVVDSPVR